MGYSVNIIEEFNLAMLEAAWNKVAQLKGRGYSDIELYHFDFDVFDFDDREKMLIDQKYLNNIPGDRIEYYWIEYKKVNEQTRKGVSKKTVEQMKLNLFYKDFDIDTHNVHVIPGLFEEYQLVGKLPDEMPYVDENKEKITIMNVNRVKDENGERVRFQAFAEKCDNGWWCPQSKYIPCKSYIVIKERIETIPYFKFFFDAFRYREKETTKSIVDYLNESIVDCLNARKNRLENVSTITEWGSVTEKYWLICWYNFKIKETPCAMHLTKPIYFQGYGFFTQYHCVNFEKDIDEQEKHENEFFDEDKKIKNIITNYPVITAHTQQYKALSLTDAKPKDVKKALKEFVGKING